MIDAGEVEVLIDGYQIGVLGPGSGFGERALLRDAPRLATVRALSPLTMQVIDRAGFLSAITGRPPEELEDQDVGRLALEEAPRPLPELFAGLAVFAGVRRAALEDLAANATVEHWRAGATVIRRGDAATELYVIAAGRAEASIDGRPVSELLPGDSFGEIAILHRIGRTATVTAVEELTTYQVSADAVRAVAAADRFDLHR